MLSKSWSVPIPLLIDDEYLYVEGDGVQPPDVPSRLGLFVSSCRLFELLDEILSSFYAEDSGSGLPKQLVSDTRARDMIVDVLDFNRRLDKFIDSIPEYLHAADGSCMITPEKNSCLSLQQQVLHCRYQFLLEPWGLCARKCARN